MTRGYVIAALDSLRNCSHAETVFSRDFTVHFGTPSRASAAKRHAETKIRLKFGIGVFDLVVSGFPSIP